MYTLQIPQYKSRFCATERYIYSLTHSSDCARAWIKLPLTIDIGLRCALQLNQATVCTNAGVRTPAISAGCHSN